MLLVLYSLFCSYIWCCLSYVCSAVSSGVGCPIFVQQLDQEVMYCGLSALAQGHWRHDVDPSVDEECLEREFFIPVPTI